MSITSPPVFSDSVNQEFFLEAQGGPQDPVSYLDRFPDTVYNKALDSVLVKFMYALMGPAGVGALRQEYLEARLAFEDAGLDTTDLDALYTAPLAFARLSDETYDIDASASLLPYGQRSQILANDASFRNRCMDFLKGVRAGGTKRGIALAAKSGLNRPVAVIENYRYVYDHYSDAPLGLTYYGSTNTGSAAGTFGGPGGTFGSSNSNFGGNNGSGVGDLGEIIILPRQDVPRSSQQTIVISGIPTSGWFTLSLPVSANYQFAQITTITGSNLVTIATNIPLVVGQYLSIVTVANSVTPSIYAQIIGISSGLGATMQAELGYPTTSAQAGQPLNMTSSGTYNAYLGTAQTSPLPYNATASQIQAALSGAGLIGPNVIVTGGPLPALPVEVSFIHNLADQPLPAITVNLGADLPSGIGSPTATSPLVPQMSDAGHNPLTIGATVTVDQVGTIADASATPITPGDAHNMQSAVDKIRPITSFLSTSIGEGITKRQVASSVYTGDSYIEVLKYESGNSSVPWPTVDGLLHWIEPNIEHEAPTALNTIRQQYCCFHDISSIISYTEGALTDALYNDPTLGPFPSPTLYPQISTLPGEVPSASLSSLQPVWVRYWDNKVGSFSGPQVALYPLLGSYTDSTAQYLPPLALAPTPNPLTITTSVGGTAILDDEYPIDYLSLPGVPQLPTQQTFWSSLERISGTDYLEIDLGTPQAVNYVYFEATSKPYQISISYDVMDMAPQRSFIPVTLDDGGFGSITNLAYNATNSNPWSIVTQLFTNTLGQMIYTRFIRIAFSRVTNTTNNPLMDASGKIIPYSIEVRNLRIGRNVNNSTVPSNVN